MVCNLRRWSQDLGIQRSGVKKKLQKVMKKKFKCTSMQQPQLATSKYYLFHMQRYVGPRVISSPYCVQENYIITRFTQNHGKCILAIPNISSNGKLLNKSKSFTVFNSPPLVLTPYPSPPGVTPLS